MTTHYPVLYLSSWAAKLFEMGGHALLGGYSLDEEASFKRMFVQFWDRFKYSRPDLDIYSQPWDRGYCLPVALHGDEGRGKLKRPVLVVGYQPIISHKGPSYINSSGNPDCKLISI